MSDKISLVKRQKIFIDGLGLVDGHFSGIGQYILGILRGIDELIDDAKYRGEEFPKVRVIIPRDEVKRFRRFGFKHIEPEIFPMPFRYMAGLWHRGKMPPLDLWCGRGKYIFPRFVDMPLLFSKNAGLVVFDLSYEHYRQFADEGNAKFLSEGVRRSINRTGKVIAISQNAKKEIAEFYRLKPSRIEVATPAVDQRQFYRRSRKEVEDVKRKYGIDAKRYILALSNLEPRKNLEALVDAYCRLPAAERKDTALLLVGVSGWKAEALFKDIIKRVEDGYNIIRPSKYVKDKDKPAIISGATMMVYPSHYEGFGMPPLEALACGVPVITADNSSLPEVVGKAGRMVPSTDTDKLVEAIKGYLADIDKVTEKARTDGPEQAGNFSWKKSAQVFIDVAIGGKS
jgi:alpha-1,3-rhamnosyl/mannosyltransferase